MEFPPFARFFPRLRRHILLRRGGIAMMKNDYRRALIMLRALEPGLSGYVRLERRTLMGTMQFNVSGLRTTDSLQAVLAARTPTGWKIVHIGTLGQNQRGQAGLNWTFDPRSIEGLPLERYAALLVLALGEDGCRTLLTGYVNGSVRLDWQRVEDAACASYTPQPRSAQPEDRTAADDAALEDDVQSDDTGALSDEQTGVSPVQEDTAGPACTTPIFLPVQEEESVGEPAAQEERLPGTTPIFLEQEETDERETWVEEAVSMVEEEMDRPAMSAGVLEEQDAMDVSAMGAGVLAAQDPMDVPAGGVTALQALGIDPEKPWPEGIEPLRAAFAAAPPVPVSAQPGYVFIRAWHSASCPECAVGVRAVNGAPESVAWAIPGEEGPQPPQGLEGYTWQDGWWIAVADAQSGAYRVIAPE